MDSKFYVSLEAEELLIEKGCPIEKNAPIYNERGDVIGYCPADRPTKSEAIDWLESKGIVIEVLQDYRGLWFYVIKISETESYVSESDDNYFPIRLEAEEAAIINASKLL